MKRLQGLLLGALYRHRLDARAAMRFQHAFGIRAIRLVPPHIGPHILHGQQPDHQPSGLSAPAPVVRGPACFHHQRRARGQPVDERFELPAREPFAVDDPVRAIGHRHFEDVLCEIHGNRRSIHIGLLLVRWCDPLFTAMMPRGNREESIPSLHQAPGRWCDPDPPPVNAGR